MRNAAAALLFACGAATVLLGGPGHGVNGFTLLGVLLALGGIALARDAS